MLGLHCCAGFSLVAVRELLVMAFLLMGHMLYGTRTSVVAPHGLSNCGSQVLEHRICNCTQASLPRGMWDLSGSGIEPMSPALADRFFITKPQGKPEFSYILFQNMCVVLVAQLCPTLCDPMNCSPPDFSVHGILQARKLEWVAISFSGDLPDPGFEPGCSALQADSLPSEPNMFRIL